MNESPSPGGGLGLLSGAVLLGGLLSWVPLGQAAADEIADTVVYIECTDPEGRKRVGSGVLVSAEGHVLTAAHVAPRRSVCKGYPGVADSNNARVMVLQPESVPGDYDVMLLKFSQDDDYPFLRFCPLQERMIRKRIYAAGFPNGTRSYKPSFRAGILSTTETTPDGIIETDSLLAQGMSGGPVLADDEKSLIGIVSGVETNRIGEPDYYGITPIAAITSTAFRLTENTEGCYPDRLSPAEIEARLDEMSGKLDALGQQVAELKDRSAELEQSMTLVWSTLNTLSDAFIGGMTVSRTTVESLAGKIEFVERLVDKLEGLNMELPETDPSLERTLAAALEGPPIRQTLDVIYEELAKPIWRFSARIEGGWEMMALAYERQISAPIFSQSLRFCLTPMFMPAVGSDATLAESPKVKDFYTLLDDRFRTNPAIVRTCQSIEHAPLAGRAAEARSGGGSGGEAPRSLSSSGQYIHLFPDSSVQQHFFAAEARREAGELEPWNGWYYLQVVKETVAPGNGGEITPEIVLRAIIDATLDEDEGYESQVILPCKVYSAGIGGQGGDMLALDPARQMSDLLSSENPRLEQNETCYSDPS
ncbi:S1 family peptidase [Rhodovulum euryhalinum]|nr:serine protease [Rhodovulum euryhalinum]